MLLENIYQQPSSDEFVMIDIYQQIFLSIDRYLSNEFLLNGNL